MSISMLDNISYKGTKSDSVRSYFPTINEMVAFSENYLPDVYITLCGEDNNQYKFVRSNSVDPVLGKWRLVGGGSGDLSSYYTKTEVNTLLDDKVDKVLGKDLSSNDFTTEYKDKLDDLENYDDTALASKVTANEDAIDVLNGDDTVTGSVDSKVATCFSDSKSYTDTSIQNAIKQTAIVCDAKPTISGTTITYYQDGVEKTVTSDNKTKFYYTDNGTNYSTIWIEGTEFTDTVASVTFSDYVSKTNDVVSDYTGDEADKSKVPNIGALDDLKSIVDDELNDKVNVSDIESTVSSSSDNPVSSSALYDEFATKVNINQGVANEGKVLKVNDEGNLALVDASVLGGDAESVTYNNSEHPTLDNVKKALDNVLAKLYYVNPSITSFTMTPSTTVYEVGATIDELTFAWSYNKEIVSQTLTDCSLADETVRTAIYSTPITTNKTFTLNASDGENSVQKSLSVQFQNKVYWGSASEQSEYNSAFILGLSNKKFTTTKKGTYQMTIGSGEYGFIAYPSSFGAIDSWYIGGFDTTVESCGTISFTNASGGTVSYMIFRTGRSGLGSITAEIK